MEMRSAVICCLLLWTPTSAQDRDRSKVPELICTNGEQCGLFEPSIEERYKSLRAAFLQVRHDWVFSTDVVAAALGIRGSLRNHPVGGTWVFPLPIVLLPIGPRVLTNFDEQYESAKRQPPAVEEGEPYVVFNFPERGMAPIDLDVVRLLLSTELFPDRFNASYREVKKAKLLYTRVHREGGTIVVEALAAPSKDSFDKASDKAQSAGLTALALAIRELPVNRQPPIKLSAPTLTSYERLPPKQKEKYEEDLPNVDSTGCKLEFIMNIPRRAAGTYTDVAVRISVTESSWAPRRCSNEPADQTVRTTCMTPAQASWNLSGPVLEPRPAADSAAEYAQRFTAFFAYPKGIKEPILTLQLTGSPRDHTDRRPPPSPYSLSATCK
jgi:hypothetical protein